MGLTVSEDERIMILAGLTVTSKSDAWTENETMTIHADTAYRYLDNYRLEDTEGLHVFGLEHNKEEAEAIARWISGNKGRIVIIKRVSPDEIREAKAAGRMLQPISAMPAAKRL